MQKPSERLRRLTAKSQLKQVDFRQLLSPARVIELGEATKEQALNALVDAAARSEKIADADKFREAVFAREKIASTGIGHGIGAPHVKIPEVRDFILAVGRSLPGIEFGAQDGEPARIIVLIGANDTQSSQFLTVVATLMQKLKGPKFREQVLEAESLEKVHDLFVG